MRDGQRIDVPGSTGATYELARNGDVYSCTCPAWGKQRTPANRRTCKHLRAHLGDEHEDARVGQSLVDAARERARRSAAEAGRDTPQVAARRRVALATALARFPAVAAHMRAVYDMALPRHVTYAAAFWAGLTEEERSEAWSYLGCGPFGILEWFADDGLTKPSRYDERLHGRFRRDPPEFVTVFSGNSDGSHWGLWYDDPRELPRLIAHNWARDSAETGPCKPTLLGSLRAEMTRERLGPKDYPHARRVLAWLDEMHALELAAHREEKIGPSLPHTQHCIGGMDPVVPGARVPDDLVGYAAHEARYKAYRGDIPLVRTWIAEAERELEAGEPLRALFLARELHWCDGDELRAEAAELGIRAYRALGRDALAEILRVHVEHRDLPSVDVYLQSQPPPPPLVVAASETDLPELARLLGAGPDPELVRTALACAWTPAAIDLLIAHGDPDAAAHKLAGVVTLLAERARYELETTDFEPILEHLLARDLDVGPGFTQAVLGGSTPLALRLAERVDLAREDADGLPPLHRAAQAGAVDVARALLARGADPSQRDRHGKTAGDRASECWQDRRAESLALMAMLRPPAAAPVRSAEIAAGDRVTHPKFGDGLVDAREGTGDAARVTVTFADATRTLLLRFVRRLE